MKINTYTQSVGLLLAVLFAVFSLLIVLTPGSASALGPVKERACYDRWNAQRIDRGGSTEVPAAFQDSECRRSNGGNCGILSERETGRVFIICDQVRGTESGEVPTLPDTKDPALDFSSCKNAKDCTITNKYLNPLLRFLSAFVGIAVVISLLYSAIQYASAAGDAQKVAAAKHRVSTTLFAFVAYILLFAFLQWLVPGGVL